MRTQLFIRDPNGSWVELAVTKPAAVVETNRTTGSLKSRVQTTYAVDILLKEGRDLVVKDSCGTSDPYVKFKIGGKQLYRSRTIFKNLNPKWEERFTLPMDDVIRQIKVKVYDYDRGIIDDAMGEAFIEPSDLKLNEPVELKLLLIDGKSQKDVYMGYLLMECTLLQHVRTDRESAGGRRLTRFGGAVSSGFTESKKTSIKTQQWNGVVTIALIEGCNLIAMDDNGLSDPYVKFKLGTERYKTKCKVKTLNPRWMEQFDLYLYDDYNQCLEIVVFDHDTRGRDEIMGRAFVDLTNLQHEKTHKLEVELEDKAGSLLIFLTISGLQTEEVEDFDLNLYAANYSLLNSFCNMDDIGILMVKVLRAEGLSAADIGGKSDPYCVLELLTHDDSTNTTGVRQVFVKRIKTLSYINVRDIHSVLEVTVYDEDRNKKVEFLGKVVVPLLSVKNGERKWYVLKDHMLCQPSKGSIELELYLIYNPLKAAVVTFNPREVKCMQAEPKFRVATMRHNVVRVQNIVEEIFKCGRFLQSCFDWESKARSICAFVVFVSVVWNFELYMLPVTLIIIFIKNLAFIHFFGDTKEKPYDNFIEEDDEDDDKKEEKAEKGQSLRERFQSVQDVCLQVQETMDVVACLCERLKNAFMWTVPWLALLAILALLVITTILYVIPFRYLVLLWGINKFTKKLRAPNMIDNNEILDYLSRVPSDKELVKYRELRMEQPTVSPSKKKSALRSVKS